MNNSEKINLIKYCFQNMCSKDTAFKILDEKGISYNRASSYNDIANYFNSESIISIEELTSLFRSIWEPAPIEFHLKNLRSGSLKGHSWHQAMPSMLHHSLQNKVRDCINGCISIDDLIEMGADIMRHEYFMVSTHDLCETTIINHFPSCIPPIRSKSVSDFVFNGIPYDLKCTNPILYESKEQLIINKLAVIKKLCTGADIIRIRAQAQKTINNWGLNRFYIIVMEQEKWLQRPEAILKQLIVECQKLQDPISVKFEEIQIQTQLVVI
jgi:hypothetical protein